MPGENLANRFRQGGLRRNTLLALLSVAVVGLVIWLPTQPSLAAAVTKLTTKGITLQGKKASIVQKGKKPVFVKDKLKVKQNIIAQRNIRMRDGYTVDGVDVSALAETVDAIDTTPELPADCSTDEVIKYNGSAWVCATDEEGSGGATYTAGTGIQINGSTISSTVVDTDTNTTYTAGTGLQLAGTTFSSVLGTSIDASEIETDAVGADELSATAIQSGDIETGDVPNDLTIDGGTVDNTVIGGTTPAAATVTDLMANDSAVWPSYNEAIAAPTTYVEIANDTSSTGTSMAIGQDSLPLLVYDDGTDLITLKCGNTTCDSGNTTSVYETGIELERSELFIRPFDTFAPAVIVYEDQNDSFNNVVVDSCDDIDCTSTYGGPGDGALDTDGHWDAIISNDSGDVMVAHYDSSNADLDVSICDSNICDTVTTNSITETGDVGKYVAFANSPDGLPVLAYLDDDTTDDVYFVKCSAADCSSVDTPQLIDSGVTMGIQMTIAVNDDLIPYIVYDDDGDLYSYACDNKGCTTGTETQIYDSTGDDDLAVPGSDILIQDSGYPLIGYGNDIWGGDFLVANCLTADCQTYTTTTLADAGGTTASAVNIDMIWAPNGLPMTLNSTLDSDTDISLLYAGTKNWNPYWSR